MRSLLCAIVMALALPARADYDFGDRRLAPLEDPLRVEFSPGAAPSAEKLREVVASVAPAREWRVMQSGGRLELEKSVRNKHLLRVALEQDARGFSLRYVESLNLMYREFERYGEKLRLVHQNYNAWVRELAGAIAAGLGISAAPIAGFAPLASVDAVPYLRPNGRDAYAKFLAAEKPRAFAIAPNGAWAWSTVGDRNGKRRQNFDAIDRALERCNRRADGECHLYALDERVVWRGQ
ncbi:MAG TPA: hypothetical protein VFA72_17390 [Burkholderiales bacterium]|nr:hypothetical protein [Burkholderiales bacterium]